MEKNERFKKDIFIRILNQAYLNEKLETAKKCDFSVEIIMKINNLSRLYLCFLFHLIYA